jgi:hypothetical protein
MDQLLAELIRKDAREAANDPNKPPNDPNKPTNDPNKSPNDPNGDTCNSQIDGDPSNAPPVETYATHPPTPEAAAAVARAEIADIESLELSPMVAAHSRWGAVQVDFS